MPNAYFRSGHSRAGACRGAMCLGYQPEGIARDRGPVRQVNSFGQRLPSVERSRRRTRPDDYLQDVFVASALKGFGLPT